MPKIFSPQKLQLLLESDEEYALIDVRERNEYERGQIFGATQVPRRSLEARFPVIVPARSTKVVLYDDDDDGTRSALAAGTLEKNGYTDVYYLEGGLTAWKKAGYPVVQGIHVLSKAFGEIVGEIRNSVPTLQPEDLKKLIDSVHDNYIIIEVRPTGEVQKTGSIPGAVNIPGVELPLRIADYAKNGKTIITTCAGRTRGFIACATLTLMGIDNVYDLNNGTLGWQLSGFDLQQNIPQGPPPSLESRLEADRFASQLAKQQGLQLISVDQLEALRRNDHKETLYIIDVRTPEEYEYIGHIAGSVSVPGGQAIQNTDDVAAVHRANIVFVCDNGTRAVITAYWYQQMGFSNIFVLDGGLSAWTCSGRGLETGIRQPDPIGLAEAVKAVDHIHAAGLKSILDKNENKVVIDVSDSRSYTSGHIPGARWVPRGWLETRIGRIVADKKTPLFVTGSDYSSLVFAASTLSELGFYDVRVLHGGNQSWAEAGYDLTQGLDGADPDDWHVHLTEYGHEEAKKYFAWEESLAHLPEYMNYFRRKKILKDEP